MGLIDLKPKNLHIIQWCAIMVDANPQLKEITTWFSCEYPFLLPMRESYGSCQPV